MHKRSIIGQLKQSLKNEKILILNGPRQSGKTTALKQLKEMLENEGGSCFYFTLEDRDYLNLIDDSPKNIFRIIPASIEKKIYLIVDEIQYLKDPSSFMKYLYDEHRDKIQLIVSGSSSFYMDKKFKDSLAGRKKIFTLYPLSFREFLVFKGESELAEVVGKNLPLVYVDKIMPYLTEYLLFGGYPEVVLADYDEKKEILRELAYSYIKKDIFESGITDDDLFYRVFKLISSSGGSLMNISEVSRTLNCSRVKLEEVIAAMRKSFHISLVSPFSNNMRKELTKMPKVYFNDTGLMNFFSGSFQPVDLRADKGKIFETAVFRALLDKYLLDSIHFWRTQDGKEIDFVIPEEKLAFEAKYSDAGYSPKKSERFLEYYNDFKLHCISLEKKISLQNDTVIPFPEFL